MKEKRRWCIYALKDPRTKAVRYVGWTIDTRRRLRVHIRKSQSEKSHKAHWLRQLLAAGFQPALEILEYGFDDWAQAEKKWIAYFRSRGFKLTNATDGGEGTPGHIPGKFTRQKMSKAHKGRKQRPEWVARVRAALLGKKKSPAACAAMSRVRKGKIPWTATMAAAKAIRGTHQTPEQIKKRIAAHIGIPRPELRRLTVAEVKAIRAKQGIFSLRKLAREYHVGQTTIFEIMHNPSHYITPSNRPTSDKQCGEK